MICCEKQKKPRLTKAVVLGLEEIASTIEVELNSGDRGYFDVSNGGSGPERVERALAYIDALITWYRQGHKENGS